MIIAPVLARDPIPYLHFRSRTELAHSKICLTYSDKAIGHSRIQQSWIFKEGKRDVLPVSESRGAGVFQCERCDDFCG